MQNENIRVSSTVNDNSEIAVLNAGKKSRRL